MRPKNSAWRNALDVVDRRLVLRVLFVAVVLAGLAAVVKVAQMAFDPNARGGRMERMIERATVGAPAVPTGEDAEPPAPQPSDSNAAR